MRAVALDEAAPGGRSCGQRLRVPDDRAGRRVRCPWCEQPLQVPTEAVPGDDEELGAGPPGAGGEVPAPEEEPWPWHARLGAVAAGLGLLSVLGLCLPVVGLYGAVALSGTGLVAGLYALLGALRGGPGQPRRPLAGGTGVARGFGARAVDLPLTGVGVCAAALALALLPLLL